MTRLIFQSLAGTPLSWNTLLINETELVELHSSFRSAIAFTSEYYLLFSLLPSPHCGFFEAITTPSGAIVLQGGCYRVGMDALSSRSLSITRSTTLRLCAGLTSHIVP
jgi:hypothetical protein